MDVRAFGSWISAPKCLFSRSWSTLSEVLGRDIRANGPRMSAGYPSQKLPLWADFSFLILKGAQAMKCTLLKHWNFGWKGPSFTVCTSRFHNLRALDLQEEQETRSRLSTPKDCLQGPRAIYWDPRIVPNTKRPQITEEKAQPLKPETQNLGFSETL